MVTESRVAQRRTKSAEVTNFVDVARRYVQLVAERDSHTAADFARRVHELLPELYGAALRLPDVEPRTSATGAEAKGTTGWRISIRRWLPSSDGAITTTKCSHRMTWPSASQ